ncbi:MAG: T9SS type A sorting domain-containing protein [Calditrichaeota bacterium]|nr:T9SS type A sorting domain-containing protein [Calditrichota bacterium]
MKFQAITILLVLFLFCPETHSQPGFQWVNTFHEIRFGSTFKDVYQAVDGNFALCGQRPMDGFSKPGWILLINRESREVIFDLEIGGEGDFIYLNSIVEIDGGGFLAAGTDSRHNGSDVIAVRVTAEGDTIWKRHYGDNLLQACEAVIELKNGNFLLAGSYRNEGNVDAGYLLQIDGGGDVIWEEIYNEFERSHFTSIRETDDGYLLAGNMHLSGWLLKVNDIGEVIWSNTFDRGEDGNQSWEYFISIISCPDGHLLSGTSAPNNEEGNFWMVKVNNQGETLWEQVYVIGDPGYPKAFRCATLMRDGGFALVGVNNCVDEWGTRERGGIVVRTNNLGEINWIRNLPFRQQEVSALDLHSVITSQDGGIIAAGIGELREREPGGIIFKIVPARSGPVILETFPEEQELNVLVGDSIFFDVNAADLQNDSLLYLWTCNNDTLTTDTCVTVTFEESGEFAIECFVSDGELADSTMWMVTAREFYLDGFTPDTLNITIRRGTEVDFSFDVLANEGIELNYSWTHINRDQRQNLIGDAESIDFTFDQSGNQRIIGEIRSEEDLIENSWQVHVRSSIYSWWPPELEVSAYVDSTLEFSITPFNEDSDSLEYVWFLNDEVLDSDSALVLIAFPETGQSEVTTVVNDGVKADTIRWTIDVQEWSFTAGDADLADLPTTPVLYPASPNPFNSSVKLSMYLPKDGHVSLSIFNINGREVSRFIDGNVGVGNQTFSWNAVNFPAGLYVVRMDTGDVSEMQKVVLVR